MTSTELSLQQIEAALREHALSYPEAYEEAPWGQRAIKVEGKTFLFIDAAPEAAPGELHLSVKLPHSHRAALMTPGAEPTGYGLARTGWVTARISAGARSTSAELEAWKAWIEESYRALAPEALVEQLGRRPA